LIPLPIDSFIPSIVDAVRRSRALVVTAEPGAGKTTRVPPALVADGPVIVLQPRRVAARAIAQRIAEERGWTIGREIGWQIRFERRFGADTRLLVATEGILTARFQQDALLSSFTTIVLDEFHERSIYADLALALAKQAWRARPDLRLVIMSATLDAGAVSGFLDDCPVVSVPGRLHPLAIEYAPGQTVTDAAREVLGRSNGDVLCFLPGAFEIRRALSAMSAMSAMSALESQTGRGLDLVPLYGALDAADQDHALREPPPGRRRVILATNIAETSVTVPGVDAVIDSGFQKVARYDADRGIDSLTTERITQDSADQRAGRAGRIRPGAVRRLWDPRDRLRPHREPEIHRIDLAATVLDVIAWGGDPRTFEWFERPRPDSIDLAMALVERLGAVQSGRLTEMGRQIQRFPLHPRLARMLIAGEGARSLARACALLSERHFFAPRAASTTSDLLSAIDDWANTPPHVQRVAGEIEQLATAVNQRRVQKDPAYAESDFRRAVLAGYPDRVAQRREPGSPRVRLASGTGGVVGPQSGVRDGEFLVALDVQAPSKPGDADSLIRVASRIERDWLERNAVEVEHRFDESSGVVRAFEVERYDALVLVERPVAVDPDLASSLLAERWLARAPREEDARLLRRLHFAGRTIDLPATVRAAAYGVHALADVELARALDPDLLRALDRDAPERLAVPSGRTAALEYTEDGGVTASVKLQELFGLAETPRIGPRREPVLFALLAPNGRPVQMTRDLKSFWERTYPEVRKELRGRYPRHPWPEDPWTAPPTARTIRRRS